RRLGLGVTVAALGMAAVVTMGFHFRSAGQSSRSVPPPAEAKGANGTPVSETRIERLSAPERTNGELRAERVPAALLASAASRNTALQDQLAWVFGGRQQHGWRLYAPLVGGLIGAEGGPGGDEVAIRLMDWQGEAGV